MGKIQNREHIKAHSLCRDNESVRAHRLSFFWKMNRIRNVIKIRSPLQSIKRLIGRKRISQHCKENSSNITK